MLKEVAQDAIELRKAILKASYEAGACHIGSALSSVEPLLDIFSKKREQDYFIFSKASGVCAFYCLLSKQGYFPEEKTAYYLKNYPLPDEHVPGVLHSIGSCGHGLPIAVGLALADRTRDVYVLMSDGELQCGTTWESLLFKRQHKLNNLKVYVDWNFWQANDKIENILALPESFIESMGVKIVKTKKGAGISFMEDDGNWHYRNLDKETYEKALKELK